MIINWSSSYQPHSQAIPTAGFWLLAV